MQTMLDFYEARDALGLPYKTVLEIRKLPARLRLDDVEDLVEYDADLRIFEEKIAGKGAPLFAKAKDPVRAREQANSRLRSGLKVFLVSGTIAQDAPQVDPQAQSAWSAIEAWVRENEGPPQKKKRFAQGQSAAIAALRARLPGRHPRDLTDADADVGAVLAAAPAGKRKSLRAAFRFVNRLTADAASLPAEVAALLPEAPLAVPAALQRVEWPDLPETLRASTDQVFDAVLMRPETLVEDALARLKAGEDAEALAAEVNRTRSRETSNGGTWRAGHRGHVSWLYRGALSRGAAARTLRDLMTLENLEAAVTLHLEAAKAGKLRPADETQTLRSRFSGLLLIAGKGLNDRKLAASFDILRARYARYVKNPHVKGFSKRAHELIDEIQDYDEGMYRRFVTAPERIAAQARLQLAAWKTLSHPRRLAALKLGASAALWALQLSRPRRRRNLVLERIAPVRDPETRRRLHKRTLTAEGEIFVSLAPRGEVKNNRAIELEVRDQDAEVLRWWIDELRGRYIAERGIPDSCYLFPGTATPQKLRDGLVLPAGCVSGAWFAEAWNAGARVADLDFRTHETRHAIATIWLADHPGDFGGAAAILGIAEKTVRDKYGADDASAVASEARRQSYERHGSRRF